jgi:hypothetical protein
MKTMCQKYQKWQREKVNRPLKALKKDNQHNQNLVSNKEKTLK